MRTDQNRRLTQILTLLATVLALTLPAMAKEEAPRSTQELKKDLRTTQQEFKQFQNLSGKLKSASRQSSNMARETAVQKLQDFMGDCIQRREGELGEVMTLKQHGKMVETGTTNVAEVGAPVPSNKAGKGNAIRGTENENRLRQLSSMKSLYIAAKNKARPAIEKQDQAFQRYTETIDKFGAQLEWAIDGLTQELEIREENKEDTSH